MAKREQRVFACACAAILVRGDLLTECWRGTRQRHAPNGEPLGSLGSAPGPFHNLLNTCTVRRRTLDGLGQACGGEVDRASFLPPEPLMTEKCRSYIWIWPRVRRRAPPPARRRWTYRSAPAFPSSSLLPIPHITPIEGNEWACAPTMSWERSQIITALPGLPSIVRPAAIVSALLPPCTLKSGPATTVKRGRSSLDLFIAVCVPIPRYRAFKGCLPAAASALGGMPTRNSLRIP